MSPFLERPDDCEHLLVVDLIVTLDRAQAFGEERNRVPLAIGALLGEDGTRGKVGTVCLKPVHLGLVWKDENRVGGHCVLEGLEHSSLLLGPNPHLALCGEVKEGPGDVREVADEPLVEVCETDELLHILLVLRCGPGSYTGDLDRVHLNMVVRDDHPKVLDR